MSNSIDLNDIASEARKKLESEFKKAKYSKKAQVVSQAVLDALSDFIVQNREFAQAIVQSDKTFGECAEFTVARCGPSISDLEVYKRAVQFWFEGAEVRMTLTLDLGDGGFPGEDKPVTLDLDSLLDF